jgi:hypothetical protein
MPSNPSPEERGLRDSLEQEIYDEMSGGPPNRTTRWPDLLDAYARAVYERCLRDAMAVVEGMRKSTEVGIIPKFGSFPVCKTCHIASMYFEHEGHDCETHNATLDLTLAALRTLTPTESPT